MILQGVSPVGFLEAKKVLAKRGAHLSDEVLYEIIAAIVKDANQRDMDFVASIPGGLQWLYARPLHPKEKRS